MREVLLLLNPITDKESKVQRCQVSSVPSNSRAHTCVITGYASLAQGPQESVEGPRAKPSSVLCLCHSSVVNIKMGYSSHQIYTKKKDQLWEILGARELSITKGHPIPNYTITQGGVMEVMGVRPKILPRHEHLQFQARRSQSLKLLSKSPKPISRSHFYVPSRVIHSLSYATIP